MSDVTDAREMDQALQDHASLLQVHEQARKRGRFCLPDDLNFEDPVNTRVPKKREQLNRTRAKIAAALSAAIYETDDSEKLQELVSESVHISTHAADLCRHIECEVLHAEQDVRLAMCKLTRKSKVRIFFAWKGTDNVLEWLSNLQYKSGETNLAYASEIRVHGGMLVAWSNTKSAVIRALDAVDAKDLIGVELCGHSRGGGIAAISNYDMRTKRKCTHLNLRNDLDNIYKVEDKVSAWLFSAPPAFHCTNEARIAELMNELSPKSVLVMQEFDFLPHLMCPDFLKDAIWSYIQAATPSGGFVSKTMAAIAGHLAPEAAERLMSIKDDMKDFHHLSKVYVRTVQADTNPVVWSWIQLHTLDQQNLFFKTRLWPFGRHSAGKSLATRLTISDHLALPKGVVADWRSDRCQVKGCCSTVQTLCDCNHPDCEMTYCEDCYEKEHAILEEEDDDDKEEEMKKHKAVTERREKLLGYDASDFVSDQEDLVFDVASRSWTGWLLQQAMDYGSAQVVNPGFYCMVWKKARWMALKRQQAQAAIEDATTRLRTTNSNMLSARAEREAAEWLADCNASLDMQDDVPSRSAEWAEEKRTEEEALKCQAREDQDQLIYAERTDAELREIRLFDRESFRDELLRFSCSCAAKVFAMRARDATASEVLNVVAVEAAHAGGVVLGRYVGSRAAQSVGRASKAYIGEGGCAVLQHVGQGFGGHIGGSLMAGATQRALTRGVDQRKQNQWMPVVKAMEAFKFRSGITPQNIAIRDVSKAFQDLIRQEDPRMVQPQMRASHGSTEPISSDLQRSAHAKLVAMDHHRVTLISMIQARDSNEGAWVQDMPKIVELFHAEMPNRERR